MIDDAFRYRNKSTTVKEICIFIIAELLVRQDEEGWKVMELFTDLAVQ